MDQITPASADTNKYFLALFRQGQIALPQAPDEGGTAQVRQDPRLEFRGLVELSGSVAQFNQ